MPKTGHTEDEAMVAEWLKAEGGRVEVGDVVLAVETQKAVLEVESFVAGTLLRILGAADETVAVGTPLALIGDDRCEFLIEFHAPAIEFTKPDFALVWEDMCFRGGPLMSPPSFREFPLPAYSRLTGFLREMGIETVIVDSDGDVSALIPLWLEGGVTGPLPFEVLSLPRNYWSRVRRY